MRPSGYLSVPVLEVLMLPYRAKKDHRIEDYRVHQADRPGWVRGNTRLPRVGEDVFCAAGQGIVAGIGGRTGDGSCLVHITLQASEKQPYLAAASNVLLPPTAAIPVLAGTADDGVPPSSATAEAWIGGPETGITSGVDHSPLQGAQESERL
jgi:hypothetical protein